MTAFWACIRNALASNGTHELWVIASTETSSPRVTGGQGLNMQPRFAWSSSRAVIWNRDNAAFEPYLGQQSVTMTSAWRSALKSSVCSMDDRG